MFRGDTLWALPLEGLRLAAEDLEAHARALRLAHAERTARIEMRRRAEETIAELEGLPGLIESYHGHNCPLECAIEIVARQTNTPLETVQLYWRRHVQEQKKAARRARDLRILTLARAGLDNAEIGRRVRMHEKSVSRKLREIIRAQGATTETRSAPPRPTAPAPAPSAEST